MSTCECASPSPQPHPADAPLAPNLALAGVLIILSGLFSGLNLGLMALTEDDLLIVLKSGSPREQRLARRILPLRKRGNLLLCTLLLGNTLVNALIAVLLESISGGPTIGPLSLGTLITTATIVIFGEIVPQSVCSRHGLAVGAASLPIVYVFVAITFPAAYPISLILDRVLGREISGVFSRQGLLALIRLNVDSAAHAHKSGISSADAQLLTGALTFKDRTVGDVMTPISRCFCLPSDAILNQQTILDVLSRGHTRIPVYERDQPQKIIALLFAKDLVGIGFERELSLETVVETFHGRGRVHAVTRSTKLNVALDLCKRLRVHMLVVVDTSVESRLEGGGSSAGADDNPSATPMGGASVQSESPSRSNSRRASSSSSLGSSRTVGIATMEDFLEEILGEEIVDETDEFIDNAIYTAPAVAPRTSLVAASLTSSSAEGDAAAAPKLDMRGAAAAAAAAVALQRAGSSVGGRLNSRRYDPTILVRRPSSINEDMVKMAASTSPPDDGGQDHGSTIRLGNLSFKSPFMSPLALRFDA